MFYRSCFSKPPCQEAPDEPAGCMNLLSSLKAEAEAAVQELDEPAIVGEKPDDKPAEVEEKPSEKDPHFRDVADDEKMQELFDQSPTDEVIARVPKTLLQALSESRDLFNSLFRYSLFLRCGPNGVDHQWLPNPRNFRKAAKGLNWFQFLDVSVCLCAFCACVIFSGCAMHRSSPIFIDIL